LSFFSWMVDGRLREGCGGALNTRLQGGQMNETAAAAKRTGGDYKSPPTGADGGSLRSFSVRGTIMAEVCVVFLPGAQ
jgi:hypothetical protein